MSLHSKARNILFQDFFKKNYQNIDSKTEKELSSIDPDNIVGNKVELNTLKRIFTKINSLDYGELNCPDLLKLIHQNFYTKFIFIIQKDKNKQWQIIDKVGKSPSRLSEKFEEKIKKCSFKPNQTQSCGKELVRELFNITEDFCLARPVFVDKKLNFCIVYKQKEKKGFLKNENILSFFVSQLENKIKTEKIKEKNERVKNDFSHFKKEIQKYLDSFLSALVEKEKQLENFLQKLKIEDVILLKKEENDLIPINRSSNLTKIKIKDNLNLDNLLGYLTGEPLDYFTTTLKEYKENIKTLYFTPFEEEKDYYFLFFDLPKNYFRQKESEVFLLRNIFYLAENGEKNKFENIGHL